MNFANDIYIYIYIVLVDETRSKVNVKLEI